MTATILDPPGLDTPEKAPGRSPSLWDEVPAHSPWQLAVTAIVVFGPLLALGVAAARLWGHGVMARDLFLLVVFYALAGHGVTVGFHRLFTHRSFVANRPLKIVLAAAGSMAFEGGVVSWVANHRLHHTRSDKEGDPHSPVAQGPGLAGEVRGLWHAHAGWLFSAADAPASRYAADIRADSDLRRIDRLFPVFCLLSLTLPFAIGWAWGGTLSAGLTAFLWAGLVRICLLHHITWSINSICHRFGRRPFATNDRSRNVALFAVPSMGESWHNAHHAFPRSARHGIENGQRDSSAVVIRAFERAGWASDVHWPDRTRRTRRTAIPRASTTMTNEHGPSTLAAARQRSV